jgi:GT2 family glycosyltransferase
VISVVVITRDRRDDLTRTLGKLAALPERPAVIVVDHGSTDGTAEMVTREHPAVTVLQPGEDAGGGGRTHGVLAASTPYVAFCDDDSWWAPGSLARAEALLDAHPDVGLLAARVLLPGGRLEPTCEAMAASPLPARPDLPGPRVLGFIACGSVVRRGAYLAAGGFPPRWGVGGEEAPFAAALADRGWQLVYVDALVAHHHPSGRRDRAGRHVTAARNDLWLAWTRRRARAAVVLTARELLSGDGRRGLAAAAREAGWARRARRPLGARTDREAARLARAR